MEHNGKIASSKFKLPHHENLRLKTIPSLDSGYLVPENLDRFPSVAIHRCPCTKSMYL